MNTRAVILSLVASGLLIACGGKQPTYVRSQDNPWVDEAAMGVGLDRTDLETLLQSNLDSLQESVWYQNLPARPGDPSAPTTAIFPMENQTTEHIEPQLNALLGMIETDLVNGGRVTVIGRGMRDTLLDELQVQQGAAFDSARAADLGRQRGVDYFVTGRVYDAAERSATSRRVQYFMFMQVLSVETGAIVWQNQAEVTKAIVPL